MTLVSKLPSYNPLKKYYKLRLSIASRISDVECWKRNVSLFKIIIYIGAYHCQYNIEDCFKREWMFTPLFWKVVIFRLFGIYQVLEGMYIHHLQKRRYLRPCWHLRTKLHRITSYKTGIFTLPLYELQINTYNSGILKVLKN
jgi:hypothetical protein